MNENYNIEDEENEFWRDVDGFEGFYQVSNHGRVKMFRGPGEGRTAEKIVKQYVNAGKCQVGLRYPNNRRVYPRHVHVLVAKAFIDNPDNCAYVSFIDKDTLNCNADNLKWANKTEVCGAGVSKSRGTIIKCIETGVVYPSYAAAYRDTGISTGIIKRCVQDHTSYKGFTFKLCPDTDVDYSLWYQNTEQTAMRHNTRETYDHKGQKYPSVNAMIRMYDIAPHTYYARKAKGYSLEECLLGRQRQTKSYKTRIQPVLDHLGNEYESKKAMCEHYGISPATFCKRLERGYTLEEALTTPFRRSLDRKIAKKGKPCVDHLGNTFSSILEMCEYHGVSYYLYTQRVHRGMTLEEALSSHKVKGWCVDHLGNEFTNVKEMCAFYGVSYPTYRLRIRDGFTLEEALTTPVRHKVSKKPDHSETGE